MLILPQSLPLPFLVTPIVLLLLPSIHPSQALGLLLFLISPPPLLVRGCMKHSGGAPAPLKGFEPIEGLFSKGTKWEAGNGGVGQGLSQTCFIPISPSPTL